MESKIEELKNDLDYRATYLAKEAQDVANKRDEIKGTANLLEERRGIKKDR